MLPPKDDTVLHFAHAAYRFDKIYPDRGQGAGFFQSTDRDDTAARIGEGHVLVTSGFWSNDMLSDAANLKYIQVCAAGYNNFDLDALKDRGIILCNGTGVNMNAVSEHAMGLLLALTRHIHLGRDRQHRHDWRPMIADRATREEELPGKTMVIYGLGTIGGRLARLAKAFDMRVIGMRRDTAADPGACDELRHPKDLHAALAEADVVVLTCPLTDETANLMDAAAFDAMKPSAYFVNVARGGCHDEAALIDALATGKIAGAGIDVTVEEPLAESSPLWDFDNAIVTPHSAGETRAYEDNVLDILVENLDRLWADDTDLRNRIV